MVNYRSLYQTYTFSPPNTPVTTTVGMVTIEPSTPSSPTSSLSEANNDLHTTAQHNVRSSMSSFASDSNLLSRNNHAVIPSHQSDTNLYTRASSDDVSKNKCELSLPLTSVASPSSDSVTLPAAGPSDSQTVISTLASSDILMCDSELVKTKPDLNANKELLNPGLLVDNQSSPDSSSCRDDRRLSANMSSPEEALSLSMSQEGSMVDQRVSREESDTSDRSDLRFKQKDTKQPASIVNKSLERVAASSTSSPDSRYCLLTYLSVVTQLIQTHNCLHLLTTVYLRHLLLYSVCRYRQYLKWDGMRQDAIHCFSGRPETIPPLFFQV